MEEILNTFDGFVQTGKIVKAMDTVWTQCGHSEGAPVKSSLAVFGVIRYTVCEG